MKEFLLTELPDDVLYYLFKYIAISPLRIAPTIYHTLCKLSKPIHHHLIQNETLWKMILADAYNHDQPIDSHKRRRRSNRNDIKGAADSEDRSVEIRRTSKRLKRFTAIEEVIHAHLVMLQRTELAMQEISEMAIMQNPKKLTKPRLRSILHEHGPILDTNHRCTATGGTMITDCIKARHVRESTILSCVSYLVEECGADPSIAAVEGSCPLRRKRGDYLPPLVIASARGMPTIVSYLLSKLTTFQSHDASLSPERQVGTCRFRLMSNPRKSVKGTYDPLGFALAVREAEVENNVTTQELKNLDACIRILRSHYLDKG